MLCHDKLGVKENATISEIDTAFGRKMEILEEYLPGIDQNLVVKRRNELITARNDCLDWINKGSYDRMKIRVKENFNSTPGTVRLNGAVCLIGPCSCLDICCFSSCEGNGAFSGSYVAECCGSQWPEILCDLGIDGVLAFLLYGKYQEKAKNEEIERLRQSIQRYSEDNERLNKQLSECLEKRKKDSLFMEMEKDKVSTITAFTKFFTEFNANSGAHVQERQNGKWLSANNVLSASKKEEDRLRNKIQENERNITWAQTKLNQLK